MAGLTCTWRTPTTSHTMHAMAKMFAPLRWKDPVRDVHMRLESNVILFIPGTVLMQVDVVLSKSNDTGDYFTPCVIPPRCIIAARERESGKIEHIEPKDVHRSAIYEYPALYWFATGERADA